MKRQLDILRQRTPVLLDPVLRLGRSDAYESERWHLPRRDASRVLLTFTGTAAIYQAIKALKLTRDDRVLIPAYNCGHEIEPVLRAGASVEFFRVDEHLQIDIGHLAASIDHNTRAVLVTHYFGFPQPLRKIRELCDLHGLTLIEDCAHALFSCDGDQPLGSIGDMAVFSPRKTLPLPHGGALVCHDQRHQLPNGLARPPLLSNWPKLLERYQKAWLLPERGDPGLGRKAAFLGSRLLVDVLRGIRGVADALGSTQLDPDDESFDFPERALSWGMAPEVAKAMVHSNREHIVATRRRNYELLFAAAPRFADSRPVLAQPPAGVCPFYFPVLAQDPSAYLRRLRDAAITAVPWWGTAHDAVPWDEFPEAAYLKRNLIALPIHQDLNDTHMQRIVELVTKQS